MAAHKGKARIIPANKDAIFLPFQAAWIKDQSRLKLMEKSRQIGLSWSTAYAANERTAAQGARFDQWVSSRDDLQARLFIEACKMWAREFNQVAGSIETGIWDEDDEDGKNKNILTFSIRFPKSRHRITALASRPRKLRGRQGVLVGDEAAFQDDLESLIKAAMAFLIWGGKVRLISTHFGVDNPFNALCQDIRAGKQKGSIHRIPFRQAVAEGLYKRVCLRMGKPWTQAEEDAWVQGIYDFYRDNADEELDCIPSASSGAYFSRALVESRMRDGLPVLRLTCPQGFELRSMLERETFVQDWLLEYVRPLLAALPTEVRSYYGMDFGRSGDLSVLLPLVEDAHLHRSAPFILEMRNVPFEQQRQVLFYVADWLPGFAGGANDATGNGGYLAEVAMQRYGATHIQRVMLSQQWYLDNMPRYKAAFEDGDITLPRDEATLSDHRAVQMVRGVPKVPDNARTKDAQGQQRHGDAAIAGALAWFASLNSAAPIEYMSDGVRAQDDDTRGFM